MSRATALDLTNHQDWQPAPMPGANLPLDVVRLASERGRFSIHGRFPPGFERAVPGGYVASEEFLVLEGELESEGRVFRRGDLTVVPPAFPRTAMRSPLGCRVLAWFGGLPDFVAHDALPVCVESIASAPVTGSDPLPTTPVANWRRGAVPTGEGPVEVITADLGRWRRTELAGSVDSLALDEGDLVRRELS